MPNPFLANFTSQSLDQVAVNTFFWVQAPNGKFVQAKAIATIPAGNPVQVFMQGGNWVALPTGTGIPRINTSSVDVMARKPRQGREFTYILGLLRIIVQGSDPFVRKGLDTIKGAELNRDIVPLIEFIPAARHFVLHSGNVSTSYLGIAYINNIRESKIYFTRNHSEWDSFILPESEDTKQFIPSIVSRLAQFIRTDYLTDVIPDYSTTILAPIVGYPIPYSASDTETDKYGYQTETITADTNTGSWDRDNFIPNSEMIFTEDYRLERNYLGARSDQKGYQNKSISLSGADWTEGLIEAFLDWSFSSNAVETIARFENTTTDDVEVTAFISTEDQTADYTCAASWSLSAQIQIIPGVTRPIFIQGSYSGNSSGSGNTTIQSPGYENVYTGSNSGSATADNTVEYNHPILSSIDGTRAIYAHHASSTTGSYSASAPYDGDLSGNFSSQSIRTHSPFGLNEVGVPNFGTALLNEACNIPPLGTGTCDFTWDVSVNLASNTETIAMPLDNSIYGIFSQSTDLNVGDVYTGEIALLFPLYPVPRYIYTGFSENSRVIQMLGESVSPYTSFLQSLTEVLIVHRRKVFKASFVFQDYVGSQSFWRKAMAGVVPSNEQRISSAEVTITLTEIVRSLPINFVQREGNQIAHVITDENWLLFLINKAIAYQGNTSFISGNQFNQNDFYFVHGVELVTRPKFAYAQKFITDENLNIRTDFQLIKLDVDTDDFKASQGTPARTLIAWRP